MKTKLIFLILMLPIILFGCSQHNKDDDVIPVIDVVDAYKKKQAVNLSDIAISVEYIPLETKKQCLTDRTRRVFADEENIIVITFEHQFVFNRQTGKFLNEVSHYGRDPNAFRYTTYVPYNPVEKTIFARGWKDEYIEYSIETNQVNTIKFPENIFLTNLGQLSSSEFVGFVPNNTGKDSLRLVIFNRNGKVLSSFCNYLFFKDDPGRFLSWGANEGWFYNWGGKLFIKELFNDTLFQVNSNKLTPKYTFNSGEYTLPSYERDFIKKEEDKTYFFVTHTFETSHYVHFNLQFDNTYRTAFYNKINKETIITDSHSSDLHYYEIGKYGFINNIDGFIQFYPEYATTNNELVALVDAYEIVSWMDNNPEKAVALPSHLQKLRNIKINDNPLIMIAKLKE